MATRSEVLIKSGKNHIYFYHHYDGYYEGVGADLVEKFQEYAQKHEGRWEFSAEMHVKLELDKYELTSFMHGDLEFVYVVDIIEKTITGMRAKYDSEGKLFDYADLKGDNMIEMFGKVVN